jgi:hypothetical protein
MAVSKLSRKDKETIEGQSARLYEAFPLLFSDVINKHLKKENTLLNEHNKLLQETIAMKDADNRMFVETVLGNRVLVKAIKAYNKGLIKMACFCSHCCFKFGIEKEREIPTMECRIWNRLIACMYLANITYTSLVTRNGTIVNHPPEPLDFPRPSMFFQHQRVSHLPFHIVFDQRGNPYDFLYGTCLTYCPTATDRNITKLHELLEILRDDALTAGINPPP